MKPTVYNEDDFFDDEDIKTTSDEDEDKNLPNGNDLLSGIKFYISFWTNKVKVDKIKYWLLNPNKKSEIWDFDDVEIKPYIIKNHAEDFIFFVQYEFSSNMLNKSTLMKILRKKSRNTDCVLMIGKNESPYVKPIRRKELSYRVSDRLYYYKELEGQIGNLTTGGLSLPISEETVIYKKRNLLIRNIDSHRIISNKEINYIEDVFSRCVSPYLNVPKPIDPLYNYIRDNETAPHMPILLVEKTPSYEELWKELIIDETLKKYIPTGKVLGYYSKSDEDICKGPHIVLCPEEIERAAQNANISFELLFSKVLIHEFAHVLMDKFETDKQGKVIKNSTKTLYSKAMEESLANMITLHCFNREDLKKVNDFMLYHQPAIYQFGVNQFGIKADWTKWRDSDKNQPELKTWFETCFKTDGTAEIRDDLVYTKEIYNAVFK